MVTISNFKEEENGINYEEAIFRSDIMRRKIQLFNGVLFLVAVMSSSYLQLCHR